MRLVFALLAAPAALAAVPEAYVTERASLTSFGTYVSAIADAAVADVGVICTTNWDQFVAGRVTAGCTESFDCASWYAEGPGSGYDAGEESDRLKLKACCYEAEGNRYYLPITGPDPSHFPHPDDADSIDEACSEYIREMDGSIEDDTCCSACQDPENAQYPYTCTAADFVGASVCSGTDCDPDDEFDCEGTLALAPLPSDWDCSTGPAHATSGFYESWDDERQEDVEHPLPDCTELDEAVATGVDQATIWARAKAEDPSDVFGTMRMGYAFTRRAMLAGGRYIFMSSMKCGLFLEPTVGTGGYFGVADDSAEDYQVHDGTTTAMDLRIYNPTVLAGASKSTFSIGSVTIVDGSNAGEIEISGAATAKISGMTNAGTVSAVGVEDIFIADTTSSGVVTVEDSTAVLIGVQNSGAVTVTGGTFEMYDVTNAGGTVTFDAGTVTMEDVTNDQGVVTMTSGSVTATGIANSGDVVISAGTVDITFTSHTGTLVISEGVTGTITMVDGGVASGACTLPSTVTTVGFTCGAGAGSAAIVDVETVTVTTTFVLGGSVDDYGEDEKAAIKTVLAEEAGVPISAVTLVLSAGSVVVVASIDVADEQAAQTAISTLSGSGGVLSSSANLETALTAAFTDAGLSTTVTVEEITATPVVQDDPVIPGSTNDSAGGCGGACIGGIVGGSAVPVLLLVLWLCGAFGKKCPSPCTSTSGKVSQAV